MVKMMAFCGNGFCLTFSQMRLTSGEGVEDMVTTTVWCVWENWQKVKLKILEGTIQWCLVCSVLTTTTPVQAWAFHHPSGTPPLSINLSISKGQNSLKPSQLHAGLFPLSLCFLGHLLCTDPVLLWAGLQMSSVFLKVRQSGGGQVVGHC